MNNKNATEALEAVDKSVKVLTKELHDFRGTFTAKEILNRRTRMLTIVACIIGFISMVGLCAAGYLLYQNNQIIKVNALNAKINCENANDSREANRKIWTLVVEQSARNDNRTPKDIQNSLAFQDYINKLYQQRDCNDLDRRYKIPDPPEFKF